MNQGPEVVPNDEVMFPAFILITTTGPLADEYGHLFGVYQRSEYKSKGYYVYTQMHNRQDESSICVLVHASGTWEIRQDGEREPCLTGAQRLII